MLCGLMLKSWVDKDAFTPPEDLLSQWATFFRLFSSVQTLCDDQMWSPKWTANQFQELVDSTALLVHPLLPDLQVERLEMDGVSFVPEIPLRSGTTRSLKALQVGNFEDKSSIDTSGRDKNWNMTSQSALGRSRLVLTWRQYQVVYI